MSVFSERLNALMKQNGWSQRELAKRVGVTESAISHYVKGYRTPHYDVLVRMAESLNTTTDYLLGMSEFISRIQQNLYKLNPDQLEKAEKLLNAAFDDAFEDKD
ncbi:MAG: helix-turn-helix domain-containing protein [Acetivibrionales bacterium]|jgi:transcriptional regulator with XRE-family HTH domain